jgi:hypothetical protein
MKVRKLKSCANCQAAFEQKAVKQWAEWIEFRKKLLVSSLTDNQRRRHYAPPKHTYLSTRIHGVRPHTTLTMTLTAAKDTKCHIICKACVLVKVAFFSDYPKPECDSVVYIMPSSVALRNTPLKSS